MSPHSRAQAPAASQEPSCSLLYAGFRQNLFSERTSLAALSRLERVDQMITEPRRARHVESFTSRSVARPVVNDHVHLIGHEFYQPGIGVDAQIDVRVSRPAPQSIPSMIKHRCVRLDHAYPLLK